MTFPGLHRIRVWRVIAVVLMAGGLVAVVDRFSRGLGATTNLTDSFPWGLWIGFDFFAVGLAAAGFTIAASVHIFNLHRFEPIVRPAIVTAFIGYFLVIAVLIIDLGRPDHFWHPLVMWNPHSIMFEIVWCLVCYTIVLLLELAPMVLARFNINAPIRIFRAISLPVVICGVIFSTLHQSSFGSLYLIIPGRMHPLWFSDVIPVLFFISCVAAGLAMAIFESLLASRSAGRKIELSLLSELSRVVVVVLALYCTLRVQDLMNRDALRYVFVPSYQSMMFLGEMALGVILPTSLLLIRRIRTSERGLFYSSVLVLLGFVANRMNTAITSMEQWPGHMYFPSWQELFITLGLVAFGFVAFSAIAKYFAVFEMSAKEQVVGEITAAVEDVPAAGESTVCVPSHMGA